MKIHILSDLHNEFLRNGRLNSLHKWSGCIPDTDADIVILAGDIDTGTRGAEWAINESERLAKPIVYVLGNHEFYGYEYKSLKEEIKHICEGTSVSFLDCGVHVTEGVRIIGATLWTDYEAVENYPLDRVMSTIENILADHHKIQFESNSKTIKFKPHHALTQHNTEINGIRKILSEPFNGETVIVTHHGPHPVCQHPAFPINELSAAFHSDLSQLIEQHDIDLWIYGHTHANLDQVINDTRIVSNQAGYPGENVKGFNASLVMSV